MAGELRKRQAARIARSATWTAAPTPPQAATPAQGQPAGLAAQAQAAKGPAAQHRQRVGAMFQKLRTAKWLKATGDKDQASVAFLNRVQRIAQVHQWGLQDRPSPAAPSSPTPPALLGINRQDARPCRTWCCAPGRAPLTQSAQRPATGAPLHARAMPGHHARHG
jgi:phage virion morphogenesis protein